MHNSNLTGSVHLSKKTLPWQILCIFNKMYRLAFEEFRLGQIIVLWRKGDCNNFMCRSVSQNCQKNTPMFCINTVVWAESVLQIHAVYMCREGGATMVHFLHLWQIGMFLFHNVSVLQHMVCKMYGVLVLRFGHWDC